MSRNTYLAFLYIIPAQLILMLSCGKEKISPADPTRNPPVTTASLTKSQKIDSLKRVIEQNGYRILSHEVGQDSSKVTFKVTKTTGVNEFGVFEPGELSDQQTYPDLFTGNIFNGKVFSEEGIFSSGIPQSLNRIPKDQDLLIVGQNNATLRKGAGIALRNSYVKEFLSTALRDLGTSVINQHLGETVIKTGEFSSFNDVKDSVFFNRYNMFNDFVPQPSGLFNFITDDAPARSGTGVFAFFRQEYYAVKIDTSAANWQLVETDISDEVYAQREPVFINSISYGRYGFITVESENRSPAEITKMVNTAITNFQDLKDSEKEALKNATIRCFFFGLAEDWRYHPLVQSALGRLQLFSEIVKNKTYKQRPYGDAPIFYHFSTVKDNAVYSTTGSERNMEFNL